MQRVTDTFFLVHYVCIYMYVPLLVSKELCIFNDCASIFFSFLNLSIINAMSCECSTGLFLSPPWEEYVPAAMLLETHLELSSTHLVGFFFVLLSMNHSALFEQGISTS